VQLRRWWELPPESAPARYSDRRDYADHFRLLLDRAVEERLRTPRAAVFMSGGLDSSMLAAVARDRQRAAGSTRPPLALTVVFDRLFADRERHFSTVAAGALGLPIHHFAADHLYTSWDWMLATTAPEPGADLANAPSDAAYARAVRDGCRVILTGFDGDALLDARVGALWRLRLARGELGGIVRELAWHLRRGRLPRVGVRAALRRLRDRSSRFDGYPPWVAPDFERRHALRERWRAAESEPGRAASPRMGAYASLASPVWRPLLDAMDPGVTGFPLEQRHPLLDLRLVRFALSLPVVPWCIDKHLFREAMRAVLPASILTRPKEPLAGDPIVAGLGCTRAPRADEIAEELREYVRVPRYLDVCAGLRAAEGPSAALAYTAFNTFALNAWLGSGVRRGRGPT
jgi:asparagine synthase (glutamine-hydrolysing)